MWHVLGARELRAAALVVTTTALAVTAAFSTTGSAVAATASSQSGSASCVSMPGDCTFTGSGSAGISGQFDNPSVVVDQTLCPPQATDAADTICGHFGIEPSVNGTVTASIAFDPTNDLDLCAYNATDMPITCSTGSGATESVTFPVTGGLGAHYELRILPISYPFPGPTPISPATYPGNVSFTAGGDGSGGGLTTTPCHKVDGGGAAAIPVTADGHFSVHVDDDRCINQKLKGKVRYSTADCDFRSTQITDVSWDATTQTATITGLGNLTYKQNDPPVPFTATAHDGGPKGSGMDTFTIDKCDGGGTVVRGDIKYKQDTH